MDGDGPTLWAMVRRHLALIVVCAMSAAIVAALLTARQTRMYEAKASLRIDPRPSQASALEALGIAGANVLATELEMLDSRQLAEEVSDSVGYRLRVQRPRVTRRDELFSHVGVAHDAPPATYQIVRAPDGTFALLGAAGDTLVRRVAAGGRIQYGGVTLDLAPGASSLSPMGVQVISVEAAVDTLQHAIERTRRNREADIVDVEVRDADPALARDVANTLVRRFIEGRQGVKQLEARSTVEFLRSQIDRVSGQLSGAERRLRDFREHQSIVSLPEEASSGVTRRAELQAQRNTLEAERQALDRLLRATGASSPSAGDMAAYRELLAFPTLLRSGMATDLLTPLTAAEERRSELLTRRTNQDPDVVLVNARIAQLQRGIRALVTTYLQGLTDQVEALDALLSRSDATLRTIPGKEIRLGELERNAKGSEQIYSMLQARLKEAEIAAASSDQTVRLIDAAVLPRKPASPKPLVNLSFALVAGMLLGISGAFLLERADRSLHTRRELLVATGVPVLGIIPHLEVNRGVSNLLANVAGRLGPRLLPMRSGSSGSGSRHGERQTESLFVFTESVSRLATNLTFLATEQRPRAMLVTSALPGDGKTTVATNLALAIARSGRRVLLIDADLRGGRIARALALKRTPGLVEVLSGTLHGAQATQAFTRLAAGHGALHVMTTGVATPTPARLLASSQAAELLTWARAAYDMVIVDTPPVTSIADATILAPLSDGVVLVARSGVTLRDAIAFAVEQLHIVRAPVLGAVLNDVDLRSEGAYDGAYEYYGRYSSPAFAAS